MICRNCNYILNGSEQFCPHCGASLPPQVKEKADPYRPAAPADIFSSDKLRDKDEIKQPSGRIFLSPEETPENEAVPPKGKRTALILCLCTLLVLLTVSGFIINEKLDIVPVLSSFITKSSTKAEETTITNLVTTTPADLPENFGTLSPDINYKPVNCYLTSSTPIALKKGPDEAYALISRVKTGEQLQILGGCSINDEWVYVYLPYDDSYGWIKAAFLTLAKSLEETGISETSETQEETTQVEAE